jgi:hypothetical protein
MDLVEKRRTCTRLAISAFGSAPGDFVFHEQMHSGKSHQKGTGTWLDTPIRTAWC